jgi:hypothetical protein
MSHQWRERILSGRARTSRPERRLAVVLVVTLAVIWLIIGERSPFRGIIQGIIR